MEHDDLNYSDVKKGINYYEQTGKIGEVVFLKYKEYGKTKKYYTIQKIGDFYDLKYYYNNNLIYKKMINKPKT